MGGKRGGRSGWSLGHREQTRDALGSFLVQITKGNPACGTMAMILMSFLTFFTSGEDKPIREQILPVFGPIMVSLKVCT
jgi:hypothetical protein